MSHLTEIPAAEMAALFERQARIVTSSGVPLEQVADALRVAALTIEGEWFSSIAASLGQKLQAAGELVASSGEAAARAAA